MHLAPALVCNLIACFNPIEILASDYLNLIDRADAASCTHAHCCSRGRHAG